MGVSPRTGDGGAGIVRPHKPPLKTKTPSTIRARPLGLGKHRHKVLGLGRARPLGLGLVFGV